MTGLVSAAEHTAGAGVWPHSTEALAATQVLCSTRFLPASSSLGVVSLGTADCKCFEESEVMF